MDVEFWGIGNSGCLAFYVLTEVLPFYLLAVFEFVSVGRTKQDS